MGNRITRKDLDHAAEVLNTRAGFKDQQMWTRTENGENVSTVGMFYVDGAYGGWALYRIMNTAGGVDDVSRMGHQPARELYRFLMGYMTAQEDSSVSA